MANYQVIFNILIKLSRQEVQNIIGLTEPFNTTNKQAKTTHFKGLLVRGIPVLKVLNVTRKLCAVCIACILHIVRYQMRAIKRESNCENINGQYGEVCVFFL